MWIVNLTANPNGSHNDHRADHITTVPEGWAVIPDGFAVPSTFPFVGIEAEEMTSYRQVEVEPGIYEQRPFTVMTVTAMTEGVVPEAPEQEPTADERRDAQIFYTAMMTDTLLEEV